MNASSKSLPGNLADGEVTAELPVLDIAAYEARQGHDPLSSTDTWSAPGLSTAVLPQLADGDAVESAAPSATLASRLEVELRSLASNLSELETRLAAKGERLAVIEAELAESRTAGLAAAERAASLSAELTGSRAAVAAATTQIEGLHEAISERDERIRVAQDREAQLRDSQQRREAEFAEMAAAEAARNTSVVASHEAAHRATLQQVTQLTQQSAAQLETLQGLEGRRGIFDSILRSLDFQLAGRDQDHERLGEELARSTTHGLQLTRDLEANKQRMAELEAEMAALASRLNLRTDEAGAIARTNNELNEALKSLREETAQRAARIGELESQLAAGAQAHSQILEVAQSAQTELQAVSAALAAQRLEATQQAAHIEDLEAQLAADSAAHAQTLAATSAAHRELQNDHAAALTQQSTLEAQLAALREQGAEQERLITQFGTDQQQRQAQLEEHQARIADLSAQVATQAQSLQAETERNRVNQQQIAIAEHDLKVAEDAINRLESEVRTRSMRVEELMRINSQMQGDVADARRWLNERDSLMSRLETEAAHSSALVDNIQRSIRTLAPGNTGNHEALREVGARLLVRSQDGREVVHVLGRRTTIGRTPDNDLQIDASFISRHHAVLLLTGNQTVIEDLNSTNGVHVNGHRVNRETLNDGDVVLVGKARFRFVIRPPVNRSGSEAAG